MDLFPFIYENKIKIMKYTKVKIFFWKEKKNDKEVEFPSLYLKKKIWK